MIAANLATRSFPVVTASRAELEASISALEAERGQDQTVLAAIHAVGAEQRDLTNCVAGRLGVFEARLETRRDHRAGYQHARALPR